VGVVVDAALAEEEGDEAGGLSGQAEAVHAVGLHHLHPGERPAMEGDHEVRPQHEDEAAEVDLLQGA
jgi:hypothetical protein